MPEQILHQERHFKMGSNIDPEICVNDYEITQAQFTKALLDSRALGTGRHRSVFVNIYFWFFATALYQSRPINARKAFKKKTIKYRSHQ